MLISNSSNDSVRVYLFLDFILSGGKLCAESTWGTRFAFIFIAARCRNSSLSKYCVRCLFLKAISWKWLPAALNYISWWFTAGIMWEMASDITSRCWLHPVNLLAAGVPPLGRVFRSTELDLSRENASESPIRKTSRPGGERFCNGSQIFKGVVFATYAIQVVTIPRRSPLAEGCRGGFDAISIKVVRGQT